MILVRRAYVRQLPTGRASDQDPHLSASNHRLDCLGRHVRSCHFDVLKRSGRRLESRPARDERLVVLAIEHAAHRLPHARIGENADTQFDPRSMISALISSDVIGETNAERSATASVCCKARSFSGPTGNGLPAPFLPNSEVMVVALAAAAKGVVAVCPPITRSIGLRLASSSSLLFSSLLNQARSA